MAPITAKTHQRFHRPVSTAWALTHAPEPRNAVGNWSHPARHHVLGNDGKFRRGSRLSCPLGDAAVHGSLPHRLVSHAPEVQVKNRLRVFRAERDWSQADLALRLEVSRQSVNAIETGKFDPSLPLAFKLARLFGTTIEEIFSDEE